MKFLDIVHTYEKKIDAIKDHLEKHPNKWSQFQDEVNSGIDSVFNLCRQFEKENSNDEAKVYKMKKLFQKNFGEYFKIGKYTKWVVEKPLGYAGDYQIIDWIYKNKPETQGIERCSDNYFLNTGAAIATRNRKEDFKRLLGKRIVHNTDIRIMDLASGPCTDIYELYQELSANFYVTCIDHDVNAISFANKMISQLDRKNNIEFIQKNVVKIALAKDINTIFPNKYDIIFSTGLFDYLNHKLSVRLVKSLKAALKENGVMIISNYRDKNSNPSRLYMEWGGDWELIYRTEDEFLQIFTEAGFAPSTLELEYERLKIMQYCTATNAK